MFIENADRVRASGMSPNPDRIRESLVHIIEQADRFRKTVSQFDILKTLFIADREHLNRFGRPITFDEYVAMQDGPVASLAYNVLKSEYTALKAVHITSPLWSVAPDGPKKNRYFAAVRPASDEFLSETDMSLLTEKMLQVKDWGYKRTWDHVHGDAAYIDAWGKRNGAGQHWMDYALLMDEADDDHIHDLKFFAKHL